MDVEGDDFGYGLYSDDEDAVNHEDVMRRYKTSEISQDDLQRMASWMQPFPLPEYMTPREDFSLANISDDVLLNTPPHLIVHLQRTAAQGGLQVISPRQTPVSCLMGRTKDPRRDLGDHVVGSTAARTPSWPTLGDDAAELDSWLTDEPLPATAETITLRTKTRTQPLTKANSLMRDPVLACLIKGRACIDILRRDDVGGDPEALTQLLADAWGVDKEDIMEMDAYTLGLEGPLLRHAIKADDVYPTVHAPIHKKLSVGVGNSEVTRAVLPEFAAMDWRRMRVACEAVFLLTCSIEGVPLTAARCVPPPGDPSAPLNRPNILAFRPLPCTAWSFEPRSFSVCPSYTPGLTSRGEIPKEVLEALSKYVKEVKPMSFAMEAGARPRAISSLAVEMPQVTDDVLSSMYSVVTRRLDTGAGRGKSAAATIRNLIYEAIKDAPLHTRLRIARYIHIGLDEVKVHLGEDMVPDRMIQSLALKFISIGELVRAKLVGEASRRGHTVDDWWFDFCSQVPERYRRAKEGTMGWAQAAMWMLFKAPTEKWTRLEKAVHFGAIRAAEVESIGAMSLPPEKGSTVRIEAAVRTATQRISNAFASYYRAVGDVAHSIADVLDERGKTRSADTLREGAYLWALRAGALRGTNVSTIAHDVKTPSPNHLRVNGPDADILVKPAPYHAFTRYKGHVAVSTILPQAVKKQVAKFESRKISPLFSDLPTPMCPAKSSIITRYLLNPASLSVDFERSWLELKADLEKVVRVYGCEEREKKKPRTSKPPEVIPIDDIGVVVLPKPDMSKSYYTYLRQIDDDEVDWFEDIVFGLEPDVVSALMSRSYTDVDELRRVFLALEKEGETGGARNVEVVL